MLAGTEPVKTEENSPKNDEDFLKVARERAKRGLDYWNDNFNVARRDLAFLYGDNQWDEKVHRERVEEGRPCLKLNQLPQFKRQVVNDLRMNTPRVRVSPYHSDTKFKDGEPQQDKVRNLTGKQDYSLAEVYEGLIRNIENNSNADSHYDRASTHAVESGFGWLRVLTSYANMDTFDQELQIKSLQNRFSVICDPDYTEPDTSDKNWLIIGDKMLKSEFQARYPGARLGDITDGRNIEYDWWTEGEYIRLAEYFYRKPEDRELVLLSNGNTMWLDDLEGVEDDAIEQGIKIERSRKVKTWRVYWAKITGYQVLEKEQAWAGSIIPVFPVWGEEYNTGDKTIYLGLTHFAEDATRMSNYWWSAATEKVALSPKAPWLVTEDAIEGHETEWENANRGNPAVLKWNERDDQGNPIAKPERSDFAAMPAAEMQLALAASDLNKSILGIYDAGLGNRSNETSGKAINARKEESDTGQYHFADNRNVAIRAVGRCLVELIPKIYDGERVIRILNEDGSGDWVKINETIIDNDTGKEVLLHDIAAGSFDVTVDAGPSFATQRNEAVEAMLRFVQAVPETGQVLLDLIAQNMDWHLSSEASRRLKLMLPQHLLRPEELEELGADHQERPLSPEQQAELQGKQAEAETAKANAAREQAQGEKAKTNFAIEKERTKQAEIELQKIQAQAAAGKPDYEEVAKMVAHAMAEIKSVELRKSQPAQ